MKHITFILTFLVLLSSGVFAQNYNQEIKDPESDQLILIGECNRKGLKENREFKTYFRVYYKNHKPDYETIKKIKEKIQDKDFKVVVVLGTWCEDSRRWVPPFFRVMDEAGIPDSKIQLVCVDSKKYSYTVDLSDKNIERIPTFIFYDGNGKEIGRIVETPDKGLEKDILKIVKKL